MTFKPGQSGNPGGRSKNFTFLDRVRTVEPKAIELLERALDKALASNRPPTPTAIKAAECVIAYSRGRPAQTQTVRVIRSIDDLTQAELEALAGTEEGEASDSAVSTE